MPRSTYSLTPDKFLTQIECQHLVELTDRFLSPDQQHTLDFRDATIIRTMLETGARPTEVISICAQDLDATTHRIFIRGIKRSRDRNIPISPALFRNVQILTERNGGSRPFPITANHFTRLWRDWRPNPRKSLHCLRHTFAINLYRHFQDILKVKHALGHRSIQNTMIYVDFMADDQLMDIRGVVAKSNVEPVRPSK